MASFLHAFCLLSISLLVNAQSAFVDTAASDLGILQLVTPTTHANQVAETAVRTHEPINLPLLLSFPQPLNNPAASCALHRRGQLLHLIYANRPFQLPIRCCPRRPIPARVRANDTHSRPGQTNRCLLRWLHIPSQQPNLVPQPTARLRLAMAIRLLLFPHVAGYMHSTRL